MTAAKPAPAYRDDLIRVYLGDCLDVLQTFADCSVDAVVTDPPAGIAFMGEAWDTPGRWLVPRVGDCDHSRFDEASSRGKERRAFVGFLTTVMTECLRVLKPGGHALVWAIPRTSHWTATAVEDAGFDVRDVITHHFGSGFPKSLNLAGEWSGWGTALKPASEHWILARKPLSAANTAMNVRRWGTGALHIDACRVHVEIRQASSAHAVASRNPRHSRLAGQSIPGRWPANLVLSHSPACGSNCDPACPVDELDRQSGTSKTRHISTRSDCGGNTWGGTFQIRRGPRGYDDEGGASRFFYVAKPSVQERDAGLEHMPVRIADPFGQHRSRRSHETRRLDGRPPRQAHNHHPTVKSVALMRYLCQLITPPHATILDCFAGSGSTLVAAKSLGFHAIGIERDPAYVEISCQRVRHTQPPAPPAEASA